MIKIIKWTKSKNGLEFKFGQYSKNGQKFKKRTKIEKCIKKKIDDM